MATFPRTTLECQPCLRVAVAEVARRCELPGSGRCVVGNCVCVEVVELGTRGRRDHGLNEAYLLWHARGRTCNVPIGCASCEPHSGGLEAGRIAHQNAAGRGPPGGPGGYTQLKFYDAVALPDVRQPMALGFKTNEIQRLLLVDEEGTRVS